MSDVNTSLREIDKPHYNYLQALYLSFFSRRLYIDVGKRWKGTAIPYLLLVFFITTIPFAIRMITHFNAYFNQEIIQPFKSLPSFYIQNGLVIFDKPMPYFIKNNAGKTIAIIDTTGAITKIDNQYPDLSILILKDRMFYRVPEPELYINQGAKNRSFQMNETPFYKDMNQYFNGAQWIKTSEVHTLRLISLVIIYPLFVFAFFALYLVLYLAVALLAQVAVLALLKFSLTYKQALRLLIVASTPQITVLMIALALNWFFVGFGLILVLIISLYFGFAALSLKHDSTKLVRT